MQTRRSPSPIRAAAALAEVSGEVTTAEPAAGPVVVLLLRQRDGEREIFSSGMELAISALGPAAGRLPEHVAYHLFSGYQGGGLGPARDGVVPLRSQVRPEARGRAYPYHASHAGILHDPDGSARLNALPVRAGS